ncbi:TPA: hypothetical protein I1751_000483 [Staphylococcus pseudintermedius]|nr:hypothetical protein [Staphylococcus pseudintermedius]
MITGVKVKTVTPYGQHIKILYTFKQFETLYEHNNEFRDKLFDWEQTVYGMRPTKAVIKRVTLIKLFGSSSLLQKLHKRFNNC